MIVVKVGGAVVRRRARLALEDAVVVHGGGPQIIAAMARRASSVTFVGGRRVTDARGARRRPRGAARGQPASSARRSARALSAWPATRSACRRRRVPELGSSATRSRARPQAVLDALAAGRIPVVAPLAEGPLNVNADDAAAALAVGLGAERILFLTDVPGVLRDEQVLDRIDARRGRDRRVRGRDPAEAPGRGRRRPPRRPRRDRRRRWWSRDARHARLRDADLRARRTSPSSRARAAG